MARIIAIAENYAFGPASKLITVCEQLLHHGHHITFIGDGTAYQLASKVNFHKKYKFNTDSEEFMSWGENLFKNSDVLISSVDRSSVLLANKTGLPTIWLDMLFWWWDEIPEYLYNIELYIQQNSVKNDRNMKLYKNKIRNMQIVGPIIDISHKDIEEKKQLLVAFGGTEAAGWYKIGKDSNYPYTFSNLIVNSIDTDKYDTVLFAGNEKIMSELNKKYGNNKFKFTILSHEQWLKEIASSKDILINPGLEAPLEAMAYEKPVFFLPPYNSSAYVELDEFREQGVANKNNSIHFADYFPHKDYSGQNLRKIMEDFLSDLYVFERDKTILSDCARRINSYLALKSQDKNLQIERQRKFIKSLGGNGLTDTVDLINSTLNKINKK